MPEKTQQAKFFDEKEERDRIIYHYCSLNTFKSIIENGEFWAQNIRKSNDAEEIISFNDSFKEALRKACVKFHNEYPEDTDFSSTFLDENTPTYLKESLLAHIDSQLKSETNTRYCVCFSTAGDLLSQWRGYADFGKGVSIGFKQYYLKNPTKMGPLSYDKIRYGDSDMSALSAGFYKKFESIKNNSRATSTDYTNAFSEYFDNYKSNAVIYKHASFSEEQERRLIYNPFFNIHTTEKKHRTNNNDTKEAYFSRMKDIADNSDNFNGIKRKTLKSRLTDSGFISYVPLNFKKLGSGFVSEIILGPKCDIDDIELKLFLTLHGYDIGRIKIKKSNSPYI